MNLKENIQKIGYYKYKTYNDRFNFLASEYPITREMINHIKKLNNIEIEFDGNTPKLINGKMIALV
jgi:hypothetical protein